jgi:hypothetical protein
VELRFPITRAAALARIGGEDAATGAGGMAAGTRIATPSGPRRAQDLKPGDEVTTAGGASARLGECSTLHLTAETLERQPDARPVRIAAGALGDGLPADDVVVAPGQSIAFDRLTAKAAALVNGVTVVRVAPAEGVTLIRPSSTLTLMAEGLMLPNGRACRPSAGAEAQLRVARRAGITPGALRGNLEQATSRGVAGWALDTAHPATAVALEVVADGTVVACGLADIQRPDLEMAGLGDGRCGFRLRFSRALPAGRPQLLHVRRVLDGAALPGSPLLLPGAPDMAGPAPAGVLPQARALAEGIDRLLQERIERPAR